MKQNMNSKQFSNYLPDEIEIDLLQLAKAIYKRIWLVVISCLVCALLAFGGTVLFITPQYQSSTLFYVNNNAFSVDSFFNITSDELTAAQSLVDTYIVILKTRKTLMDVIDYGEFNLSYEQLSDMISAEAVNSTEVFEVVVTGPNPKQNYRICNAIAHIMPDKIANVVDGSSVRIVDYAVQASHRYSSNYARNTLIGFLLGLFVSVGAIVVYEMLNKKINSIDFLQRNFDEPVLASIPDMEEASLGKFHMYYYRKNKKEKEENKVPEAMKRDWICDKMNFIGEEAYKQLRTKLLFSFSDDIGCHVLGITSALAKEGKSFTAINMAYTLAQLGKRVLLIDSDMRLTSIASMLDLKKPMDYPII